MFRSYYAYFLKSSNLLCFSKCVPLRFISDAPVVTIASFAPQLAVITSKQRPRKLTILGSDGEDYAFLLKGHEDLRQDERVMQVVFYFSLWKIITFCNAFLANGILFYLYEKNR